MANRDESHLKPINTDLVYYILLLVSNTSVWLNTTGGCATQDWIFGGSRFQISTWRTPLRLDNISGHSPKASDNLGFNSLKMLNSVLVGKFIL